MSKKDSHGIKLIDFRLADKEGLCTHRECQIFIAKCTFWFQFPEEDLEYLIFHLGYFWLDTLPWHNSPKEEVEKEFERKTDFEPTISTLQKKFVFLEELELPNMNK